MAKRTTPRVHVDTLSIETRRYMQALGVDVPLAACVLVRVTPIAGPELVPMVFAREAACAEADALRVTATFAETIDFGDLELPKPCTLRGLGKLQPTDLRDLADRIETASLGAAAYRDRYRKCVSAAGGWWCCKCRGSNLDCQSACPGCDHKNCGA